MTRRTVGILVFPGVELLDFAGPAEVFIVAAEGEAFRVVTIAERKEPIATMGGVTIVPDHRIVDAPDLDVLVVPGGDMRNFGAEGRAWLAATSPRTEITLSVCMGAMLLAEAGLLDGLEATTHHWGIERLRALAPHATVVEGTRFIDAGRVITTAGVTAGIDGALSVVSRLLGPEAAVWTAREWMEHPGS